MAETDKDGERERGPGPRPVVVGIGASAGGLPALQELFAALGDEGKTMAFVVVQHLGPHTPNVLPELLRPSTPLRVVVAEDGMAILAGQVVVAPAGALIALEGDLLRVSPLLESPHRSAPIDFFLRSLAAALGGDAVGVILSGTGSDGTLGLRAIGEAGGLTIAQDASSARFEAMPQSAAELGLADHVLPPARMPPVLIGYARRRAELARAGSGRLHLSIAEVLPGICDLLEEQTGHNFKHYKTSTLVRRVERRMQVLQIDAPSGYVERLRASREEAAALFRELLIGVTAFFRDQEAFESLAREVIPRLFAERARGAGIRVWVPGCATGEEAYSIAMLIREHASTLADPREVQIFATDIDDRALAVARHGIYPQGIAEQVSPERLARFFVRHGHEYHVSREIREICLFSSHNLITDPPFSRLDLISCRNLLIYLGPHLQKKLFSLFHYALRPNGYLFLGPSESIGSHEELFKPLDPKHRIAQRRPTAIRPPAMVARTEGYRTFVQALDMGAQGESDLLQIAQRIVLDEFAPKYAVVSDEGRILCVSGGTSRYLEPSAGLFQNNIMSMARSGLRVGLRAALSDAVQTRRTAVVEDLSVGTEAGMQRIRLIVQPMPRLGEDQPLFMVVFQDVGSPVVRERDSLPPTEGASLVEQLERELFSTRADLERTIQDLEASNEELKSSNEELLSMNEELQSANEELETSKEEIQAANEALARAHSDLQNVFASARIATIFLDDHLVIRSFTPAVTDIYNLLPGDVGRPLSHITHRAVAMPDLPSPASLRAAPAPAEDELQLLDGRWYMRKALPYRTHDGRSEGMVVTFTDVTALRESEARLRLALESGKMGTWEWNPRTGVVIWDALEMELFDIDPQSFVPRAEESFFPRLHPDDRGEARRSLAEVLQHDGAFEMEFRIVRRDGEVRWLAGKGHVYRDERGQPLRVVGVNFDITESKAMRRQAEADREARLSELSRTVHFSEMFMGVLGHDLRNPLGTITVGAGMLAQSADPGSVPRVAGRILRSADRMARMIDQLLDFTRIRLGRGMPLERRRADLAEIARSVVEEFETLEQEADVRLDVGGDTVGTWDHDRLAQLLSNLVGNAIEHRVAGTPVLIRVDGTSARGVSVEVRNEGVVPEELLPVLFEPLQTKNPVRKRRGGSSGLGLGLYISRQVAEAHGGTLTVRCDVESGATTFEVFFPRKEEASG